MAEHFEPALLKRAVSDALASLGSENRIRPNMFFEKALKDLPAESTAFPSDPGAPEYRMYMKVFFATIAVSGWDYERQQYERWRD